VPKDFKDHKVPKEDKALKVLRDFRG
jgi:hypothetical protein